MTIKFILDCHDCEREIILQDAYDESEAQDIKHCPLCGGTDNIEVREKGTRND